MGAAAAANGCTAEHEETHRKSGLNEMTCGPGRCDVGEELAAGLSMAQCQGALSLDECVPVRLQGLNDQACADVLLVQAAQRGDLDDLRVALMKGAVVDNCANLCLNMGEAAAARPTGITPLMRACACGHEDVIKHLLEAKANPHRTDTRRWTALCHALASGELGVAKLLLETAGSAERQKVAAHNQRDIIIDHCEESVGAAAAEELRGAFKEGGLLMLDSARRV